MRARMRPLAPTFTLALIVALVDAFGRSVFECPDASHVDAFASLYSASRRLYTFNCSSFGQFQLSEEACVRSESASTLNGDLYLTCPDTHYTAGISIVGDEDESVWSLLCCQSSDVRIKTDGCVTTAFISSYEENFDYALARRYVVRKWHSIFNEARADRLWWLQICPVDATPSGSNAVDGRRFARAVPTSFRLSRFDAPPPLLLPVEVGNRVQAAPSQPVAPLRPVQAEVNRPPPVQSLPDEDTVEDYSDLFGPIDYDVPGARPTPPPSSEAEKFFNGFRSFLENVQDGLTFAQFALPTADQINGQPGEADEAKQPKEDSRFQFSVDVPVVQKRGGRVQQTLQQLGFCQCD